MLLRRLTDFVLQSRLKAMGVAFLFSFIPLIGGSISILIAALVTLRKGAFEGTFVLGAAILPYLFSYAAYGASEEAELVFIATSVIVAINVLTWLYALVLRRYSNWSLVIEGAALSGIMIVAVIYLAYPNIQNWWVAELTHYLNKMVEQATVQGDTVVSEGMQAKLAASVQEFKRYATGIMVVSAVFNAVLQLLLARWWQAILFNPGGLRKELYQIRLSYLSAIIFVGVVGLAYLGQSFSLELLPIAVTAFCAAGLSLIHHLLATNKTAWLWLMLVYLGILFLSYIGVFIVAFVGLLDSLFDFRERRLI